MGIGKTLIDVLNENNENANSLANKVGVTPSTIYSIIDRDNMRIDIGLLAKICKVLNTPMERFYNEYIEEKSTAPTENDKDDANKQKLMNNYDKMNEKGQNCLVQYSDYLADKPENLKSTVDLDKREA